MDRITKSLVALVAGAAVVFIYATSAGANNNLASFSVQSYGTQFKNYTAPAKQKEEKPLQTAHLNRKGVFGKPDTGLENLAGYYT
ncbi:hypothetical protein HYX08_06630 [Candidatus Woesearchaeota archaeon]|nr:hypothetical protein [Candidatus Woesearchaeota archaeon]